jgi:hypothetical protein
MPLISWKAFNVIDFFVNQGAEYSKISIHGIGLVHNTALANSDAYDRFPIAAA